MTVRIEHTAKRWAIQWRSDNRLDGCTRYFIGDGHNKMLFQSRALCRKHIEEEYGYIRSRPDLQAEPHGWKMPVAVKVSVTVRAA